MFTNVAETGCTEQSITHGVGDGIGITMAVQPTLTSNMHASQHERAIVISKTMYVKSLTNAHL
jgi:hypothetical protein